jgi:predicted ester cyclase
MPLVWVAGRPFTEWPTATLATPQEMNLTAFRFEPHVSDPSSDYEMPVCARRSRANCRLVEYQLHKERNALLATTDENKAIVARWFTEFWGNPWNPDVVDELAAPDIRFEYSMHDPLRGQEDVKAFATEFRAAFPDLNFWGTADLIAEGDYVVGQWEGGGTHTGIAYSNIPVGSLPAASGKTMRFTGTTVLRLQDGLIVEEIGLDDGVTVLQQLGLIPAE